MFVLVFQAPTCGGRGEDEVKFGTGVSLKPEGVARKEGARVGGTG
jgi:hypothetical protein